MKVLVIGATGTLGGPIVEALKSKGHEVIGVSRKSTPSVDISKPEELKSFLEGIDPVDHIVCTGGGVYFGENMELNKITDESIYLGINSKMMGQVNVVRFGYPKINAGGSILLTGGIVAYKPLIPNASHVGMINSALNGFVISCADDFSKLEPTKGPRVNVIHPPLIKESAVAFGQTGEGLPSASEAAEIFCKCLFDETGTGQEYFIPGFNAKEM